MNVTPETIYLSADEEWATGLPPVLSIGLAQDAYPAVVAAHKLVNAEHLDLIKQKRRNPPTVSYRLWQDVVLEKNEIVNSVKRGLRAMGAIPVGEMTSPFDEPATTPVPPLRLV